MKETEQVYTVKKKVFEKRVTRLTVLPDDENIFSDRATHIEIDDESGGEFLTVTQEHGSIRIEKNEWPMIRQAIDEMIEQLRDQEATE